MERRRRENPAEEFKPVERGWCLGGEQFRQELLAQVNTRPGPSHYGEVVQEALGAQAGRLVAAGLDLSTTGPGQPRVSGVVTAAAGKRPPR